MSATKQRYAAIVAAAQISGRSPREEFDNVYKTWRMSLGEHAQLLAMVENPPVTDSPKAKMETQKKAEAELRRNQAASVRETEGFKAAARYLELSKVNPVAAATLLKRELSRDNKFGELIDVARAAEQPPTPPEAA